MGVQQPKASGHLPVVFLVVVVATALTVGLVPMPASQPVRLGSVGATSTVLVRGFAASKGNVVEFWVVFTNATGYSYSADIGANDPNYDPAIGGVYSIDLPNNSVYTVQLKGILLGQIMICTAGTLTLQGSMTVVGYNVRC